MWKIILLLIIGVLFISCLEPDLEDEMISDGVQRLIIDNAFYVNNIFSCKIQFDYYVTEDTCLVDGYGIDFRDGFKWVRMSYGMTQCIPGIRYTFSNTIKHRAILPPIVGMYGYPLHENDSLLHVIDTLQKKY